MQISLKSRTWDREECAVFLRSKERYGALSNMSFGYPLTVNGVTFQGPEGLYQALKFSSHPEVQREIAGVRSGMEAKKAAYAHKREFNRNWDDIKTDAMRFTLGAKLLQHPERFGDALKETAGLHVVEMSSRDPWWGAKPEGSRTLRGVNVLGQLLTQLRDALEETGDPREASLRTMEFPGRDRLLIAGRPATAGEEKQTP